MEFKIIKIAGQTWMANNFAKEINDLSYNPIYELNLNYGLLYTFAGALKGCPDGWRLPSLEDWKKLADSFGGWDRAGGSIKSELNIFLAGFCKPDFEYLYNGNAAMFWTSTEKDNENAYVVELISGFNKLNPNSSNKQIYMSVRYIKDKV